MACFSRDLMERVLTVSVIHQSFPHICWFQLYPPGILENLHHEALEILVS